MRKYSRVPSRRKAWIFLKEMVIDTPFVFCVPYQRRLPFGPCNKLGWRLRQLCSTERWGKACEITWRHVPLNINLYRHRHSNLKSQPDGWPPCCHMTCSRHTRKLAVKVCPVTQFSNEIWQLPSDYSKLHSITVCNVAADCYTTSQIPCIEPDTFSHVSKRSLLTVSKLKTPAQCHCSLAAICGAISTMAVNRNTLQQGTSVLEISRVLSEGGTLSGFRFYCAVSFCVSITKTIG